MDRVIAWFNIAGWEKGVLSAFGRNYRGGSRRVRQENCLERNKEILADWFP